MLEMIQNLAFMLLILQIKPLNDVNTMIKAEIPINIVRNNEKTWKTVQKGIASHYGPGFAGKKTANGEIFDPEALTAASKTLKFGSWVLVVNPSNGLTVEVRINDRGPFVKGRVIDLSTAAARVLKITGIKRVLIQKEVPNVNYSL